MIDEIKGAGMTEIDGIPEWVLRFVKRWQKRVFANDVITCAPSNDSAFPDGWNVVITRGRYEAQLVLNPEIFASPYLNQNIRKKYLLNADNEMRFALKAIKLKQTE